MNQPRTPQPLTSVTLDGVTLVADLWEVENPRGVVVIRTPYNARCHASVGQSWCDRGFHCVIQDVRGRYRSSGKWQPYSQECADGAEVFDQLAEKFTGLPFIAFGASYAAHTALEAARGFSLRGSTLPVAIIALVPALGLAETAWNAAGQPQFIHRIGWWHEHGVARESQEPLSRRELERRAEFFRIDNPAAAASRWGWSQDAVQQWDSLWKAQRIDLKERYGHIRSPLAIVTGDHDFFDVDAHRLFQTWAAPNTLISGPWGHRLGHDLVDEKVRRRLQHVGGIGAVLDAWLSSIGVKISGPRYCDMELSPDGSIVRFDPADGRWAVTSGDQQPERSTR